jgi:hypothetical protein
MKTHSRIIRYFARFIPQSLLNPNTKSETQPSVLFQLFSSIPVRASSRSNTAISAKSSPSAAHHTILYMFYIYVFNKWLYNDFGRRALEIVEASDLAREASSSKNRIAANVQFVRGRLGTTKNGPYGHVVPGRLGSWPDTTSLIPPLTLFRSRRSDKVPEHVSRVTRRS